MDQTYKPGDVIPDKKPAAHTEMFCLHDNLVPLEIHFARVSYPDGYKNPPYYDYSANVVSANIARVKKYFCLDCRQEVPGPKRSEE